ncbi:CERS6 synthase, partial [Amia calva]|nr:CERS6 synthase [Amia calva]
MAGILAWFWNERFWLPHNVTWADLKNTDEATFPQAEDLYLAFPLAFCIFMIRLVFERFIARPCALGLKMHANGPQKAQPNAILEKVFTAITKATTSWLWNTRECWYNYPYQWAISNTLWFIYSQPLTADLHYYYIVELSFYLSLMFSQFTDIRRKDFLIMFMHHLATISLITFSYVNNMVRVGTLVMCLHDAADVLLEAAKMANYAKCQRLCDLMFVMFALVFISTRLGVYPVWILNTTLFESWDIVGPYPSWWVFNFLLILLQVLHSFWSYLIIKIACKAISKGKVSKDDRSDIESSSDEEDTQSPTPKIHSSATNGTNRANGTNGYLSGTPCQDEH